ncbi:MAG: hypothetical protein ACUVSK_08195, partial [Desulfotomaculales bacterium]
ETALESLQSGTRAGSVRNLPLFVPQMLVPVGGLLLGLQGIFRLVRDFKIAVGFKPDEEGGN